MTRPNVISVLVSTTLACALSAGQLFPGPTASGSDLRMRCAIQGVVLKNAEPILLTISLRNNGRRAVFAPIYGARTSLLQGNLSIELVDPLGNRHPYHVGINVCYSASPQECRSIAPGDSYYMRISLWWPCFARSPVRPALGEYRLVAELRLPRFAADGREISPPPAIFSDSVPFTIGEDTVLTRIMEPLQHFMWEWFWLADGDGIFPVRTADGVRTDSVRIDSLLSSLKELPTDLDTRYPFLFCLLTRAAGFVPQRRNAALVDAVRFAADNPTEPLAEELEFDIVRFSRRAGLLADADRMAELLWEKCPRNARLVGLGSKHR